MRRIPANQLTQEMYGQHIRFAIPVRRGQSVQTMVLGHVQCDGEWVLIGAKGAGAWDRYRIQATAIVEVRGEPTTPRPGVVAMLPIPTKPQKED